MEEQLKINSWDISEIVNMIEQYKGNKTITKYIDELLQEATESLLSFGFDPDSVATTMSTIKDDIFKQLNQNKSQNKPTKSSNPDKVDKPHWASGSVTSGTIEVKSVLNTRDGRVIGNAVVADIVYDFVEDKVNYFLIVTDAGDVLTINLAVIKELFHMPKWVTKRYPSKSAEKGLAEYYKNIA